MKPTVGIPQALLYYEYFPLWKTFFDVLGVRTLLSPATNKTILESGLKNCVDEACLPVKVAMGHVVELTGKADYIFLPRVVSVAAQEYICPKFLGFPDMVRNNIKNTPPLIDNNIDLYRPRSKAQKTFREIGRIFTPNPIKINRAFQKATKCLRQYQRLLEQNLLPAEAMKAVLGGHASAETNLPGPVIALIGHSYNIYDRYISMDLISRLKKMGVNVLTVENVIKSTIRLEAGRLPKKLFWTMGQQALGATFHFLQNPKISGIIHVTSFGCGPDALVGELMERYIYRTRPLPFLKLTLDEHTGEAGVITRLEAFLDMVQWKAV